MSKELFSKRHGFHSPIEKDITVRFDAPHELRGVLINLAYECGFKPSSLRSLLCKILQKRPNMSMANRITQVSAIKSTHLRTKKLSRIQPFF